MGKKIVPNGPSKNPGQKSGKGRGNLTTRPGKKSPPSKKK